MSGHPSLSTGAKHDPIDPKLAEILRIICTGVGLAKGCPYGACRRSRHCATRDLPCWQAMQEYIKPLIAWQKASWWKQAVTEGRDHDVHPTEADAYQRILDRGFEPIRIEVLAMLDEAKAADGLAAWVGALGAFLRAFRVAPDHPPRQIGSSERRASP